MKRCVLIATAVMLACAPVSGYAGNNKGQGNNKGYGNNVANCPPGLAKKNPPCIPPGQAKKYGYKRGDYIRDNYVVIRRPERYGLDPNETYYRVGDQVLRVDRETREVLDLIGAVSAILN